MNVQWVGQKIQKLPRQTRMILTTCIYGLAAGLAAVAFHLAIEGIYHVTYGKFAKWSPQEFALWSFVTIMSTSVLAGLLLNVFCKDAAGSGIPQLKVAFWKDFGSVPWRVVWVKFVAGCISIGGGCSLGREGPSVQIAGGMASNAAKVLGEHKQNRRNAAAAGAAAGLAAAFNTPLAAITFVLEEIVGDLNSRFLGSVLLASVIGAFVVHGIVGEQPAFKLFDVEEPNWVVYLLIPVVAACCSFVGVLFQKWTMNVRRKQKRLKKINPVFRPAIGAFITWIVGCLVFLGTGSAGVFGIGYVALSDALANNLTVQAAGMLLLGKLIATVASYGMGGCGGVFSPTLFLGGVSGFFVASVLGQFVELTAAHYTLLAVVGMSSCLGAVVRTPVTGILIVFEMTHEFSLVPALMLGALVSQSVSRRFLQHNFYETILEQDGHKLEHLIPPRDLRSWQQLPVSVVMKDDPVVLAELTPEAMQTVIDAHPYNYFPVVIGGKLKGILSRQKAVAAIEKKEKPVLQKVATCLKGDDIRSLQYKLIESPTGVAVLLDKQAGQVKGIVTLHDLLREEVGLTKDHEG